MHLVWISALCGLCSAAWAQTNLPPVAPGVFNASARIEINAPIEKAWEALLDFPSYPNWNPFGKPIAKYILLEETMVLTHLLSRLQSVAKSSQTQITTLSQTKRPKRTCV